MDLDRTYTLDSNVRLDNNTVKIEITSYFDPDNGVIGYFEEQDVAPQLITKTFVNADSYSDDHTSRFEGLGILNHDTGKLRLFENAKYPAYIQGEDNIVVEFTTRDHRVANFGEFLTYTDNTLIFYDIGNEMVIFSEYNNLDYYPASNYIKMVAVGAYPIGDSTVAIFTKDGITYLNRQAISIENENIPKYAYSVLEGKPGTTLEAKNSLQTLSNDVLFLSNVGVNALVFGNNIKSNERYALERSAFINGKLLKHKDLSKAQAITYNNKYYLAIDDCVYIADARYKTSPRDQDMNDTFNYEWWYWDNMPVLKWVIIDGELKFVTKAGKLAEFVDEREDEDILMLSNWGSHHAYIGPSDNDITQFQINMSYIDWIENGNILQQNQVNSTKKYEMYDVNKYNGRFKLREYDTGIDVTNDLLNTLYGDDEVGQFGKYKQVFIARKKSVKSEWYTPVVNMGTSLYSKNLLTSTLTFEPDIEGNVKFGYLTRRSGNIKEKESNLSSSEGVDFDNLDFTDFSFSVGFACSRTLKTRVRNYNYIQFRIVSDNNKDCALNNFVVTYTIGRKNKGVR